MPAGRAGQRKEPAIRPADSLRSRPIRSFLGLVRIYGTEWCGDRSLRGYGSAPAPTKAAAAPAKGIGDEDLGERFPIRLAGLCAIAAHSVTTTAQRHGDREEAKSGASAPNMQ